MIIACLKLACGFVFIGVISLSRSVYGKANSVIPMIISAQDGGGLTALVNARVNISVVAGLVAPPVFEQTQYYFTVSEDVLRGTVVGIVQASIKTGRVHNKHMPLFMLFLTLSLTAHDEQFSTPGSCCNTTCTNKHWATIYTSEITSIKKSILQLCLYISFLKLNYNHEN